MALDPCCDQIAGGRISISVADQVFEGRGDCEIEPRFEEREAGMTSSGKMYGIVRAKTAKCEIPYANLCERDPLDLWDMRCKVNVNIVEMDRGWPHIFTDALITGTPKLNAATGEMTGLVIETDLYKRVPA